MNAYLNAISYMSLTNYVTYNATDEELRTYGLDDPELTVAVDYSPEDGETSTFVLHVSRDPEEKKAAETAAEKGESYGDGTATAYARVGDSPIVYKIFSSEYFQLTATSYDDLRHSEVIWADFEDVRQIGISLEGASYTLTAEGDDDERTWSYQDTEVGIDNLQSALKGLSANSFTGEAPTQKEEISLTVYLDNENQSQVSVQLYRYDGSRCLAVVDGEPVSLVARTDVVDLIEAVNSIVLN